MATKKGWLMSFSPSAAVRFAFFTKHKAVSSRVNRTGSSARGFIVFSFPE
jgi:hypothetical protein